MKKPGFTSWFILLSALIMAGLVSIVSSKVPTAASVERPSILLDIPSLSTTASLNESVLNHPNSSQHIYLPLIHAAEPVVSGIFYLSPTGNDNNAGTTEATAWATFDRAWQDLYPGDTLILRDGVYYQSLRPNRRNGEAGKPITIRAKNDGQAIIDGEFERTPVALLSYLPSDYYVIEGIIARNGSIPPLPQAVIRIESSHNILRRVSAYDAHTDHNTTVISLAPTATYNLIEDCIAAGTGRKMINMHKNEHNTIRRCFVMWGSWDGRERSNCWPWGDGIEFYNSSYNTVENSIVYGQNPTRAFGVLANHDNASSIGNQVLGSIALLAGSTYNGELIDWDDTRPQPTQHACVRDFTWPSQRVGFSVYGQGEIRDNLFQDIFAWGNAGLGFSNRHPSGPGTQNSWINRVTLINNGLDAPSIDGGIGTNALPEHLEKYEVTNSYIEGTEHSGEGARLTHRYVDGVLTNEPLWPWPMEDRIQTELGISVTDIVTGIIFDDTLRE